MNNTNKTTLYAHSHGIDTTAWQPLVEHLSNTANLASTFSKSFNAYEWGKLVGLAHDIGKGFPQWQAYLVESATGKHPPRTDHKNASASILLALADDPSHPVQSQAARRMLAKLIAFAVAGHHGGLPNGLQDGSSLEGQLAPFIPSDVTRRPDSDWPPFSWAEQAFAFASLPLERLPRQPPQFLQASIHNDFVFRACFFVRLLFSCLVDADFLDTERFMDPTRADSRPTGPSLEQLDETLARHLKSLAAGASPSQVNMVRSQVLRDCLATAESSPGLFSLTVPTGGGKTFSSLAFALRHAKINGLNRVIYAIPFTSIVEQTASVFREALDGCGLDVVIEHQSLRDPDADSQGARLASENYDAPVVVTTNVQLFESLFSNKPSRCRKLHNLAKAVVVLDEAQCLPRGLLLPTLRALECLLAAGASVVLCTATQPALEKRDNFDGLPPAREIVAEPGALFEALSRVELVQRGELTTEELAEALTESTQVLAIVDTRAQAAEVFSTLRRLSTSTDGIFHLSRNLCALDREDVLRQVRQRLKAGLPCRLVSTTLVEAGVDVDFPKVFRSMAGLDSLAQAAGRCNREGKLSSKGQLTVFTLAGRPLRGERAAAADAGRSILNRFTADPFCPEAINSYFREIYWLAGQVRLDIPKIVPSILAASQSWDFPFEDIAAKYRMIDSDYPTVFVPVDEEAARLLEVFESALKNPRKHPGMLRGLARRAGRLAVDVPRTIFREMVRSGIVREILPDQSGVLMEPHRYDRGGLGLALDDSGGLDVDQYVV